MNTKTIILVVVALFVGVALYVFYNNGPEPDDRELTVDEKRGRELLKAAQDTCLSGESSDAGVKIDLETDFLTKFNASSGVNKEKAKGAVNYVDEQVRSIQDKEIRDCIERRWPQIQNCLLGNCNAALEPDLIDFQFTYETSGENPFLVEKQVMFNLQFSQNPRKLILQPGAPEYYIRSIPFLEKGQTRKAAIFGVVREGYESSSADRTIFCLSRPAQISKEDNYTLYNCVQGDSCKHDGMSPKWFELCPASESNSQASLFSIINTAYADIESPFWAIPTLETLQQREDMFGIGYTHFKVEASSPINLDYDSFFFDIVVNGMKANINGLPGSFNTYEHDSSRAISFEFGLQNLNFSGHLSGCDEIELNINFVKDGAIIGSPVTLKRSYVALRDARDSEQVIDGIGYLWTGKYQRAPRMYDNEVFISSLAISNDLDFDAHKAKITENKREISAMKIKFDALGLEFEGRPLVAVIRPPLTKLSYGLVVAIVEESKQLRFTFDRSTAKDLEEVLLAQRSQGQKYRSVIRDKLMIYSMKGSEDFMASPAVCI
jgi:hypothetical protein